VKNGEKSMNVVCASIKDENYDSAYEPLVFEIEGRLSAKDWEE
jgi:hypothetical protein